MKKIFTILAFITLTAVSSFGQNSDDEITNDTVEYYTMIDEVQAADFGIEGGMVYSAGVIKVYDITGRLVAMSRQEFNVNTISSSLGVYIIVAEEGVIKCNSVYAAVSREKDAERERYIEEMQEIQREYERKFKERDDSTTLVDLLK